MVKLGFSDIPPNQVLVGHDDDNDNDNDNGNDNDDNENDNDNDDDREKEPWYFSLNNRRLWVLKQLRDEGYLEQYGNKVAVRVRLPKSQQERERYTTKNCAVDARIMGEKEKQSVQQQQQQKQ